MIDHADSEQDRHQKRLEHGLEIATRAMTTVCWAVLEPVRPMVAQSMPQSSIPGQAWYTPILTEGALMTGGWVVVDGPTQGWPAGWIERLWRAVMNAVELPDIGIGAALGVAVPKPLPSDLAKARVVQMALIVAVQHTRVRFVVDLKLLWYLAHCGFRHGWQHRCLVGRVMPISEQPITGEGYGALPMPGGEIPLATFDDVASWANDVFLTWRMLDRRCQPMEMAKLLSLALVLAPDAEANQTPEKQALYADLQRTRAPLLIQEAASDWWQCLRIQWANQFCSEARIPVRFLGVPHHWGPTDIAGLTVNAVVRCDDRPLGCVAVTLTEQDLALLRSDARWMHRDPVRLLALALRRLVRSVQRHAPLRLRLEPPRQANSEHSDDPTGMPRWTSLVPVPLLVGGTTTVCALRITADATVVGEWFTAVETPAGAVVQAPFRIVAGTVAPDQPRPSAAPQPTTKTAPTKRRSTRPSAAPPTTSRGALWCGVAVGAILMLITGWWGAGLVGNDGLNQLWAGAGAGSLLMLVVTGIGMVLRHDLRSDLFAIGLFSVFLSGLMLTGLGWAMYLILPLQYRILAANPGTAPATIIINGDPMTVDPGTIRDIPIRRWAWTTAPCTVEHAGRSCTLSSSALLAAHVGNGGAISVNRLHQFAPALGPGLYYIGPRDAYWTTAHGDVSFDTGELRLISLDPPGEPVVIGSFWK